VISDQAGSQQVNTSETPPDDTAYAGPPLHATSELVLCVDDDPNILAAFQRQFRKMFQVETAIGPEEGLAAITNKGPFAVVISDLRMPGMNGIQFLAAVKAQAPDTVRVMLTGQADMADAIAAVNQGAIFRFLLKPSSPIILRKVIESALEQYRLIMAERQLTQQTLVGCVEVLSEILSIVEPTAFSRTNRVLRCVRQLSNILKLTPSWEVEAAAMLSQIGWITIPAEIANKLATNQSLSPEESRAFRGHPAAAARIIERIPRLETVAKIVEAQLAPVPEVGSVVGVDDHLSEPVGFAAAILRAAIDFDDARRRGLSAADALTAMELRTDHYHPQIMSAIARIEQLELEERTSAVPVAQLAPGMILEQDICTRNGMCLVGKGIQVTATILERVHGFWHAIDTDMTVLVRITEAETL
jgi:FixJ family two-component response regulator